MQVNDFSTMRQIARLKTREDAAAFVGAEARYENMSAEQRRRYDMIETYMLERNARRRARKPTI